jgi:hypothetical protein
MVELVLCTWILVAIFAYLFLDQEGERRQRHVKLAATEFLADGAAGDPKGNPKAPNTRATQGEIVQTNNNRKVHQRKMTKANI